MGYPEDRNGLGQRFISFIPEEYETDLLVLEAIAMCELREAKEECRSPRPDLLPNYDWMEGEEAPNEP